ncbi:MAG TPA: hypothetical protein VN654_02785 [Vicinamibacterales bacterium]|jgi:CheY-like chemotaxis protein|nr:hypothetical protein [Vicinamibacterales bacterium]
MHATDDFWRGLTLLLVNSSVDTIELLTDWFTALGAVVHHLRGLDLCANIGEARQLVQTINPDVVLFDLAVPYDRNWKCFEYLRRNAVFAAVPIITTTVNRRALEEISGPKDAFEIMGSPHDLWKLQDLIQWRVAGRAAPHDV